MSRVLLSVVGGSLVAVAAAGLTIASLAVAPMSHSAAVSVKSTVSPSVKASASIEPTASPAATPTPSPTPTATPSVTPTPSASPSPAAATARINASVNLRLGPSTATKIMAVIAKGTSVTLGKYSDNIWQQVIYNDMNGYVSRQYLDY